MKKILVLFNKITPKNRRFCYLLQKQFGEKIGIDIRIVSEISIQISQDKTLVNIKDKSLSSYDLVYIRKVGDKNLKITNIIARYLKSKKVKFIDSSLEYVGRWEDKLSNDFLLGFSKMPVIPSLYFDCENLIDYYNFIKGTLGGEFIAKDVDSQRMEGIYIIKNHDDYLKLKKITKDQKIIYQKFINSLIEYRLLVLGGHVRTVLIKDRRIFDDLKVVSPNGIPEKYLPVKSIPKKYRNIAERAAKILKLDVAGVDLMIEKDTNKAYLIEVNRGPGITFDKRVSPELPELAKYIKGRV